VINGSALLREWVDDTGSLAGDLDVLTTHDETVWVELRRPFLLY
jgi:hypothetical protein